MAAYYNEIDEFVADWLQNLISHKLIADGVVDRRSIEDVRPEDLKGFTQCHFFAGIGVWSFALRQAGWDDDTPVWTGSCPCQPFSTAGKGAGFTDERHLWPAFYHLIEQCNPPTVLGEQVASKDADPWIDLVQADMEALDYSFGAVPFPAAGVGSPCIRDRLYWVADTYNKGLEGWASRLKCPSEFSPWARSVVVRGRDEKLRPIEPGIQPLAYGSTQRVGRIRAYGNALNAKAAQVFIESFMEAYSATTHC